MHGRRAVMTSEWSIILCRVLVLIPGLIGLYFFFVDARLNRKTIGWGVFQFSLILLWLSGVLLHSGFSNPLLSALLLSIAAVSLAIFMIFSVFLIGISRQYGTLREQEIEKK